MSEQTPEADHIVGGFPRESSEIYEEKSITGSAQSIGIEPSDNFVAPTMALDSFEPTADD
jgi:hypothetical protein